MMHKVQVIQFGIGNVGRALIRKILDQNNQSQRIQIKYLGIANSSSFIFNNDGIDDELLSKVISSRKPQSFSELSGVESHNRNLRMVIDAIDKGVTGKICVVDVTNSPNTTPILLASATRGHKLVLANKKPLVQEMSVFEQLKKAALGCRATVGAGLPVINGLQSILDKNEKIIKIEGCFSGALGTLCSAMEKGNKFSKVVIDSMEKGYTEPDPREDLAGTDVARKILIISRFCDNNLGIEDVKIERLYPNKMEDLQLVDFIAQLTTLDQSYKNGFESALHNNTTLRYVATQENNKCYVGLKNVPIDSEIGILVGAEKVVVFFTDKNPTQPIVINGKGAGPEYAAQDVLEDIIEVFNLGEVKS